MNLFDKGKKNKVKEILSRSIRPTIGLGEREITVKLDNVGKVRKILEEKGFFIIGTSESLGNSKKIWFAPRVGL